MENSAKFTCGREQLQYNEEKWKGKTAIISHNTVQVEETLNRLKTAKSVAILRAKDADVAIKRYGNLGPQLILQRGLELVELGCQALEITMDSHDVFRLVKELVAKIPGGFNCSRGVWNSSS